MTIHAEFLNFIVPRKVIEKKYPGGWNKCLADHKREIGEIVWFDDHLFRYGSKEYSTIANMLREWEKHGFVCVEMRQAKKYWTDICIYASKQCSDIDCEWLDYCSAGVFLKGCPAGKLVGPNSKEMITVRKKLIAEEFRQWAFWYLIVIAALITFLKYTVTT